MSLHQTSTQRNPTPQSPQTQDDNQQSGGASPSVMPPPMSVGDHQGRQLPASLETNRAGQLSGNGPHRTQAASPHINRPQSTRSTPLTPAPTTSDVHRADHPDSECSSLYSTSSVEPSGCTSGAPPCSKEIMHRFFRVDPGQSPLAYLDSIAIKEGVVRAGEDMYARKCEEEGWGVQNRIESNSSWTLGRSEENN